MFAIDRLRRRGASRVEVALLSVLLIGTGLLVVAFLGQVAQQRSLAQHHSLTEDLPPQSPELIPETPAAIRVGSRFSFWVGWKWFGIGASILLNVVLWRLVCRRRRLTKDLSQRPVVNENAVFGRRQEILQALEKHFDRMLKNQLRVADVMSLELLTLSPTRPVDAAQQLFLETRAERILVCDDEMIPLGVVAVQDLAQAGNQISDIMNDELVTVSRTASLSQTITLFLRRRLLFVAVTEGKRCCGVLTATDLIMTLQCGMFLMQRQSESQGPQEPFFALAEREL